MDKDIDLGVALISEVCPVCSKELEDSSSIILNSKLTKEHADKVREMDKKKFLGKEFCPECKKHSEEGVFIVAVDPERSTDEYQYRTGGIVCIKDEAVKRWIEQAEKENNTNDVEVFKQGLEYRLMYAPYRFVAKLMQDLSE